jgi:hypothetical protein
VAIVTPQLVPFLYWIAEGDRGPAAAAWALRGAVTPADWMGVLAPVAASPADRMVYAESLYLGAPILVCAFLGVWRARWVLAGVAGLGLLATLPEIGGESLFLGLTGGLVRYPSRFALVGLAIMIPFVGRGADEWLEGRGRALAVTASSLSLVGCIWGSHPLRWWVAGTPAALMLIAAVAPPRRWLRGGALVAGAAGMIVAAVPLLGLRANDQLQVSEPVWPEATDGARLYSPTPAEDVMPWLSSGLEPRRLWPVGYLNLDHGLTLVRTDSPVANGRLAEHLLVTDRGPESRWWLDVLAARWVVLPIGNRLPDRMVEVRERNGMRLLQNLDALPEVGLLSAPPIPDGTAQDLGGPISWEIDANRCSVTTSASQSGWVWISLAPVTGWHWRLDDRDVSLEQGPGIVQYLEVPAGQHHLVGRYRPPAFLPAMIVSLVTLLILVAHIVSGRRAARVRR